MQVLFSIEFKSDFEVFEAIVFARKVLKMIVCYDKKASIKFRGAAP